MLDEGIIDYFQDKLKIHSEINCPGCSISFDEFSIPSILESNCPICGSEIVLNNQTKEMLSSFQLIYNAQCFVFDDKLKEHSVLLYLYHLINNKEYSFALQKYMFNEIDDALCIEIFGIEKEKFLNYWKIYPSEIRHQLFGYNDVALSFISSSGLENCFIDEVEEWFNRTYPKAVRYVRKLKRLNDISLIIKNQTS